MSESESDLRSRAEALRLDFDAGFARAAPPLPAHEDFLAARIGDGAYAIRLSEIAGVHRDRKITRVRSRASHLLGVAAFRGTTAPIYDLREILGYSVSSPPRWLVLAQSSSPVGFAFDALEGHVRIAVDSGALEIDRAGNRFVQGVVRTGGRSLSVLRLASLLEAIMQNRIA
ncbi:MAG: chemotaxis protein CheW [Polyangiaceae bacterium]